MIVSALGGIVILGFFVDYLFGNEREVNMSEIFDGFIYMTAIGGAIFLLLFIEFIFLFSWSLDGFATKDDPKTPLDRYGF